MPNHYVGDLLPTIAISGMSRVRTELLRLAVVASLTPHPVQMHRQFPRHRYLGNLPSPPHGQVKELVAPLLLTALPVHVATETTDLAAELKRGLSFARKEKQPKAKR